MIGKWIIVIVAAAVLAGALCGCLNVDTKVPKGPYVKLESGEDASGQIREFLKEAREDGIISKTQYERLIERVKED